MKRPKTTNEMRASFDDNEGVIKIRPKRKGRNLPNAWDDKPMSSWGDRSWKRYRKQQYKAA